jgi:hypothetical protein
MDDKNKQKNVSQDRLNEDDLKAVTGGESEFDNVPRVNEHDYDENTTNNV